jgi:hypothetical protein
MEEKTDKPHVSEDKNWAKAMMTALSSLGSDHGSVLDKLMAAEDTPKSLNWVWQPIMECLPSQNVGKALMVLLRNGLLFERLLVSPSQHAAAAGLQASCVHGYMLVLCSKSKHSQCTAPAAAYCRA